MIHVWRWRHSKLFKDVRTAFRMECGPLPASMWLCLCFGVCLGMSIDTGQWLWWSRSVLVRLSQYCFEREECPYVAMPLAVDSAKIERSRLRDFVTMHTCFCSVHQKYICKQINKNKIFQYYSCFFLSRVYENVRIVSATKENHRKFIGLFFCFSADKCWSLILWESRCQQR